MAFLDNSGDIILDAVLTDHGRKVLAEADGSFVISKFGLSDDEVDYSLYNKNHPSGSAYYDLEILQTPILEAFTDNAASMHYNLITYNNLEHLFLPVLLLNTSDPLQRQDPTKKAFIICANQWTENNNGSSTVFTAVGELPAGTTGAGGGPREGFMYGASLQGGMSIRTDSGLNTTQISATRNLDPELVDETYVLQMDSRLGNLATTNGTVVEADYIDDDDIAYYTVTKNLGFVTPINTSTMTDMVIQGPRGSAVQFKIQASLDLQTSSYLFLQLGGTDTLPNRDASGTGTSTVYYIDTTVKLTGTNTGATISIPVRFVRLT